MIGDPRRVGAVNVRVGAVAAAKASLARLRARLTMATSAALFLLPLPLMIVIAGALIADDIERLTLAASALASFWMAGVLTWRGLASEMGYVLGERIDLDRIPRKFMRPQWTRTAVVDSILHAAAAATSDRDQMLPVRCHASADCDCGVGVSGDCS